MASDLRLKSMNALHRAVIVITRGRLGWEGAGMPILELTTIGRKSGEARVSMLSSPLQENATIVVVALGGGGGRHPAWYLNLLDNPRVTVRWRGDDPKPMVASTADDEERARLWPLITELHPEFAGWQDETTRELPVVLLSPTD